MPGLPGVVEALSDGRYDLLHLCSPGPAGIAAALTGRLLGLPTVGSYHTELAAYARARSGDAALELRTQLALAAFYGSCDVVLSPSSSVDERLGGLGIPTERIARWDRGVDLARFSPERRVPGLLRPGAHQRPLRRPADAREGRRPARRRVPGGPPAAPRAAARDRGRRPRGGGAARALGDRATFLGWLEGDALAAAYASADLFLFCSQTDTYGQVLLEAQASGPAGRRGRGRRPGRARRARPQRAAVPAGRRRVLGLTLAGLAGSPSARRRLTGGGLRAVQERTWEAALGRLAEGWRLALAGERGHAAAAGGERRGRRVRRGGTPRERGGVASRVAARPV